MDPETSDFARRAPRRAAPVKKSGWKKPRRILGLWARVGLLLCFLGVLAFLAVALVAKAVKPYREARAQSAQLAQTRAQSSALAAQNALLERHIAYLKTGDGTAAEARKMGYLRPGEIPIVVEGLPSSEASPDAAPSAPAPAAPAPIAAPARTEGGSGAARRFWHHLIGR